ncbi:MAG TPA: hypothetical protein PLX95_00930 [bacterium]|nr:hypothetical protein [bacterium]
MATQADVVKNLKRQLEDAEEQLRLERQAEDKAETERRKNEAIAAKKKVIDLNARIEKIKIELGSLQEGKPSQEGPQRRVFTPSTPVSPTPAPKQEKDQKEPKPLIKRFWDSI